MDLTAPVLVGAARQMRADATTGAVGSADFALHLDLALTEAEFARVLGEPFDAQVHWRRAVDLLRNAHSVGPWLYRGAAQAGWVALRLRRSGGEQVATAALDDIVTSWIEDYPDRAEADLPRGLLGLGVYVLAHPDEALRDKLTGRILDVVEARLEADGDGLFLRSRTAGGQAVAGTGGPRHLGLAHGAAGLVSFLATVVGSRLSCGLRAAPMLDATTRWLLRRRSPVDGSLFPRSVETRFAPARSAWCHGDPGVWLGLSAAARVTGSAATAVAAREVAAAVVTRPPEQSGVVDGTICHGAAGLLWIAHRIRLDTGHPAAMSCAGHWARYLLEHRAAGPLEYFGRHGMARDHSFLEGDAGVALALLAVATGTRPSWEELLLAGEIPG